ncbi:hypothetical protein [Gordonia sp. 4N]|uniref:hypothetical protein n=1 Tax=Gordonia sp. 4N TaxID=2993508 RepID=UPI00224929A8|nr:hypothetical protein [Gordonia sp. 4N]MCX2755512.1 hypothetical protein [Gordonia sp. 4N]
MLDALETRRQQLEDELNLPYEWDEREQVVIRLLGDQIDRREALKRQFSEVEKPSQGAKLSAEMRQLERSITDLLGRLDLEGAGAVKSRQHQRAANTRWQRRAAQ